MPLMKSKRINKFLYGWKILVNYGQGYEYECFELTWKDARENLNAYRQAIPQFPVKIVRGREANPQYTTQNNKA